MGIKVFLVEDEMVIRNGIVKSINWEKEGYRLVGEASDGELAYPMILKEKPDILLTDIKMPFMDGLELSRLVKQELPDTKILIFSGYDEFEYAKEAIRIGVTEYLLKPVSSEQLLEVMRRISKQIEQDREEREILRQYQEDMKENVERERQNFFSHVIRGEVSIGEAVKNGKKYGMDLSAGFYSIILFKIFSTPEENIVSEHIWKICEKIETKVDEIPYAYYFQRGIDGWVFLLTAESKEQMEERQKNLCDCLAEIMKNERKVEYFGGIGKPVERIRNLGQSFRDAERIFAERFTRQSNQFLSGFEKMDVYKDDEFQIKDLGDVGKSREMIEKFLNNGTKEELEEFMDTYFIRMKEDKLQSTLMRQYIIMDIYIVIMSFCEKIDAVNHDYQQETEKLKSTIQNMNSVSEIRSYITYMLNQAIELRDSISKKRYADIIKAAEKMISEHYMSEEISLNSVADSVGMSPSYFSSVFSKESGKTFVEFLTETRMEKAKELLMCSALKTSEIGYEVGYKDPHYFSYIFKKTQGCSPKDYRARGKE
ncbi:response regulator [Bariatricus sp. HCP28S3_E4]|uniref:response regulator n=1 Tax=unclassified Bariatricus TaxID=2677046 RepID=UPI003F8890FE